MSTVQRLRFVVAVLLWTSITSTLLVATGVFSLELLFVVAFVGFLVLSEMTGPSTLSIPWRARVRWVVLAGVLVFAGIVIRRILRIVPSSFV